MTTEAEKLANRLKQDRWRQRQRDKTPITYTKALEQHVPPDVWAKKMREKIDAGDISALLYVANRIEGMPRQSVDTTLTDKREYTLRILQGGAETIIEPPTAERPMLDTPDGGK